MEDRARDGMVYFQQFTSDDCYMKKSGGKVLRHGAVRPVVQACLICLDTDTKLHSLCRYKLEEAYRNLTGFEISNEFKMKTICIECAQRLVNFKKFREKSLRARALLMELFEKNEFLTIQNIKTINRENNSLTSSLSKKIFKTDHCDLHFTELSGNEDMKYIEIDIENIINENDIKDESKDVDIQLENLGEINRNYTDLNTKFNNEVEFVDNERVSEVEMLNEDSIDSNNSEVEPNIKRVRQTNKDKIRTVQFVDNRQVSDESLNEDSTDSNNSDEVERNNKRVRLTNKGKMRRIKLTDNKQVSDELLNENSVDSNKTDEVEKTKVKLKVRKTSKDKIRKLKPARTIKLFKVASLNYEEQLADVVKRKDSTNYQNSFYKCTMCFKGFNDKNAYNAHLLRHTNKFGDFECALCGLHFKLRYRLSHHIRQNHSWRYSCVTCPFVTKHKRSAHLHERWHDGARYKCSHCDEQFIRVSTYMTHLRIKHPSEFSCTICGYSFVGRKGLDQHMNMKHRFENVQNDSGPVCEPCDIRFATDAAYNQHMKVSPKHSSDGIRKRNDPSVYCKKQYKGIRQKTADSDSVTCEQCGIELKDYRLYTHHFKRAHPDKNRTKYAPTGGHCLCEQCGKVFQSQALLRYHMPVHSGQTTFTCDVCDKGFMLRANLLIHKKIHSDTRESFECPVCGKSFAYQSNRARHMVLHNGLKAFKCEICEKNFSTAPERSSHVAHVHLKKPWPKRNRTSRVARHVRRRRDTTTVHDE